MKKEYDFKIAERGRFYHPSARFNLPIFREPVAKTGNSISGDASMKTNVYSSAVLIAVAETTTAYAADSGVVDALIANLKSKDDKVRGPAWQGAGKEGAPAVKPLAALMSDPDFETARCAKRALQRIVRHAARPGAAKEARAVEKELIELLRNGPVPVHREVLWLLSEIGGDGAVAPMAALLVHADLREDARCALTRIPGKKATAALQKSFATAPEEFKFALADSLRARGEKVAGYPTKKLTPVKQTTVVPKVKA
jgi:hypothetical protein